MSHNSWFKAQSSWLKKAHGSITTTKNEFSIYTYYFTVRRVRLFKRCLKFYVSFKRRFENSGFTAHDIWILKFFHFLIKWLEIRANSSCVELPAGTDLDGAKLTFPIHPGSKSFCHFEPQRQEQLL